MKPVFRGFDTGIIDFDIDDVSVDAIDRRTECFEQNGGLQLVRCGEYSRGNELLPRRKRGQRGKGLTVPAGRTINKRYKRLLQ